MSLVLGLDSGGSKTVAALADPAGAVTALRLDGGLDPIATPDWRARLAALLAGLEIGEGKLAGAVLGLPFHEEVPAITVAQSEAARALIPAPVLVQNDVRIAFDGAFAGGAGALVLAGTGSMAWASLNGPGDAHVRTGGWGDVFGDEGSAYWIGRETLARVSREVDGRAPDTGLARDVLAALGIEGGALIDWCYGRDDRRRAVAGLARLTSTLAQDGNAAARAILEAAGDALAEALLAAWRQAAGDRPLRWSHAGGVTRSNIVVSRIAARAGCAPVPALLPPVGGALYRAALAAGWEVTPRWLETVGRELEARIERAQD